MLALAESQFKADIPPKPNVLPVQFDTALSANISQSVLIGWHGMTVGFPRTNTKGKQFGIEAQ